MDPSIVVPMIVGTALGYVVFPAAAAAAVHALGPRRVKCPETGEPALVELNIHRAVVSFFTDGPQHVCECSRWPEKAGCDRACETQVS